MIPQFPNDSIERNRLVWTPPTNEIIWVTGAGGLIGNYLVQTAPRYASNRRVIGLTHTQLDVTDFSAVREQFRTRKPQLIVHCAALSRSPACQENPSLARKLN